MTGLFIFFTGIDQKGEKAMEEYYIDLMFKGAYEHPVYLKDQKVVLTGEGRNRRLNISAGSGWIKIYVDLHVYDGWNYAYISPASIELTGTPDIEIFQHIICDLTKFTTKVKNGSFYFTKHALNDLYRQIINNAK